MSYSTIEAQVLAILKTLSRFKDSYTASTISFTAATKRIGDSANGMAFFRAGDRLTVTGSTSNNSTFTVTTVTAGYVVVSEDPTGELAGAAITLTRPATAAVGDYRLLDYGTAEIAVLEPGPFQDEIGGETLTGWSPIRWFTWDIVINLFERYSPTEPTVTAALSTMRDEVVAAFVAKPILNSTGNRVQLRSIATDGEPVDVMGTDGSGPYFKMQSIRVRVRELDSTTAGNA